MVSSAMLYHIIPIRWDRRVYHVDANGWENIVGCAWEYSDFEKREGVLM